MTELVLKVMYYMWHGQVKVAYVLKYWAHVIDSSKIWKYEKDQLNCRNTQVHIKHKIIEIQKFIPKKEILPTKEVQKL